MKAHLFPLLAIVLQGSRARSPNYALERSVKFLAVSAAGAGTIFAPAAPDLAFPRPAQRGR